MTKNTDGFDNAPGMDHPNDSGGVSGDTARNGDGAARRSDTDLSGMTPAAAKEYIFNFITTLKLTEQQVRLIDDESAKWRARIDLAKSKGQPELAAEVERELARLAEKRTQLAAESAGLKSQIEEMRGKLPALAARERSVDADLLEQELLMAAGYLPGEEEKARNERQFRDMEESAVADAALAELKAKMGKGGV